MPHSYAIAIFRFKDYQAANIPVLPVVKGIPVAKLHITLYILAFMVPTLMLFLGGYAGPVSGGGHRGERLVAGDGAVGLQGGGGRLPLGAQAVHVLHRHHYLPERDDVGGLPAGRSACIGEHAALIV